MNERVVSVVYVLCLSLLAVAAHARLAIPPEDVRDPDTGRAAFAAIDSLIDHATRTDNLLPAERGKIHGALSCVVRSRAHQELRQRFGTVAASTIGSGSAGGTVPRLEARELVSTFATTSQIPIVVTCTDVPGAVSGLRRLGGVVRHEYRYVAGAAASVPLGRLGDVARLPGIERIWFDAPATPALSESVPQIGADSVHELLGATGVRGEGVRVGVVDTGIDGSHGEFAGRLLDDVLAVSGNHGTHVAGIIGAADNGIGVTGVAPSVTLFDSPMEDAYQEDDWFQWPLPLVSYGDAIEDAAHPASGDVDVVNMSLGWAPYYFSRDANDPMSRVIIDAPELADVTFVMAAGNEATAHASGNAGSDSRYYHGFYASPG